MSDISAVNQRFKVLSFDKDTGRIRESGPPVAALINLLKGLLAKVPLSSVIGISCLGNFKWVIVPSILSIVQSGHVFYCLPADPSGEGVKEECNRIGLQYIIADTSLNNSLPELEVIGREGIFVLYRCPHSGTSNPEPLLYIIRTSGSTGQPKVVRVPKRCLQSNIDRLGERFRITADDVILNCSPPTFDPFLVDLFLATTAGASLLLLHDFTKEFYTNARALFSKKSGRGATVIQITPSVFRGLSKDDQIFILSSKSSLRIICFGGEAFPEELLNGLKWDEETKAIYNIYGITEMSCWASLSQFQRGQKLDLAQSIHDELFEVRDEAGGEVNEGELWIGSRTRKCFINEESSLSSGVLFRSTGDLVERGEEGRIYFQGRNGDVIKRFGVKVNLLELERKSVESGFGIRTASCVFYQLDQKILLFICGPQGINIGELQQHLQKDSEITPDEIILIEAIPLNSHGKVSKSKLIEHYLQMKTPSIQPLDLFNSYDLAKSFQDNGGTSIIALQLLHSLERSRGKYPDLIALLLNPDKPMSEVVGYIHNTSSSVVPAAIKDRPPKLSVNLKVVLRYDLKKCVDASPTLFHSKSHGSCVAVGSHSHKVVVLPHCTDVLLAELDLPDRIESKILSDEENLFVGCYDGYMYNWNVKTNKIDWKFNSHGMIKSEPIICGDTVIFGNYSEEDNLFAVNKISGSIIWSKRVGRKGILARATPVSTGKNMVITTLDGTIEVFDPLSGQMLVSKKLNNPIFANPISISDYLIITEVTGVLHCFKLVVEDKLELRLEWELETGGNVFQIQDYEMGSNQWDLYFGAYDNYNSLYKIELSLSESSLNYHLSWKVPLKSPVYARPAYDRWNHRVICCSTKGEVNVIDSESGNIIGQLEMPGEIFSSPLFQDGYITFGCRDNFLYCLNMSEEVE